MKAVVIGGTGHVGTYLVPRLVEAGYEVVSVTRARRRPYREHGAWAHVEQVEADRGSEDDSGAFAERIAGLDPDVVIDMICFSAESAQRLAESLRGRVQHLLVCGTTWVHGPSRRVPTRETEPRRPFGDYGINKARMEAYLLEQARRQGLPATVLHPGHIVGPGWVPVNPAGNLNPDVYRAIARGEELALPNLAMETLHHVHADDVAHSFMAALASWSCAVGESFHVVSEQALTLRGYAEELAAWFGVEPNLRLVPWEQWKSSVSEEDAARTWDHIAHSPNYSIEKARRLIGYRPRYGSLEAIQESLGWLIREGQLRI